MKLERDKFMLDMDEISFDKELLYNTLNECDFKVCFTHTFPNIVDNTSQKGLPQLNIQTNEYRLYITFGEPNIAGYECKCLVFLEDRLEANPIYYSNFRREQEFIKYLKSL